MRCQKSCSTATCRPQANSNGGNEMALSAKLKAAEAKLKAAVKERDAFQASMDKARTANEKRLAKLQAAVDAAQVKRDKVAPIHVPV